MGDHAGQAATLVQKDNASGRAVVQLVDEFAVLDVAMDDIAAFAAADH